MSKSIFVSHSSQNAWLLEGLLSLIEKVDPEVDMFCSSEAVIPPGLNYKECIYARLEKADMFIAVLSEEYWKSKYAIMELGAAYQRWCFDNKEISIQPVLVPPLNKGLALANTPLVEIQLTDLTNPDAIALLLKRIAPAGEEGIVDNLGPAIARYAAFVKKTVLSRMSLVDKINYGAYYDEPANNPIPKNRIVTCEKLEDGKFVMDFRFSRLDYIPGFASVAIDYKNKLNLREYLHYDRESAFTFTLDNKAGVLNNVKVEFKNGTNHATFDHATMELVPGVNKLTIPLEPMDCDRMEEVSQISFVIFPADMNDKDGEIIIDNIKVEFLGNDLF